MITVLRTVSENRRRLELFTGTAPGRATQHFYCHYGQLLLSIGTKKTVFQDKFSNTHILNHNIQSV